jgi:dolichol kinase
VCFQHFQNQKIYFYLPILILTICDPIAALVGKKFPFGKYKIGNDYKTLMGSMAFFVSCFVILFVSFYRFDNSKSIVEIIILSLIISITTTFTEALSKNGIDNLTIPFSVLLFPIYSVKLELFSNCFI